MIEFEKNVNEALVCKSFEGTFSVFLEDLSVKPHLSIGLVEIDTFIELFGLFGLHQLE